MSQVLIAIALFFGLVVCMEIGYRFGVKRTRATKNALEGFGAIEAAVFGLFALLLSLSFVGAHSRLDARRHLVINEANAIAKAYLRVDLLSDTEQPEVRRLFRDYLDERVRINMMRDEASADAELQNAERLQKSLWSRAITASKQDASGRTQLLLPAINDMIDIAGAQAIAVKTHLPGLVFTLLIAGALLSGLVAGFGMARGPRNTLMVFVYSAIVALTLCVMLDMEHPRGGLIDVGAADRAMIKLRDSIQ